MGQWFRILCSLLMIHLPLQASSFRCDQEIEALIEAVHLQKGCPSFLVVAISGGALKLEPHIHFDKSRYRQGCGVIGHCWAILVDQGELVWMGGHSGESDSYPPHYLDGYSRLALHGSLDDLSETGSTVKLACSVSPSRNPVSYLHHLRNDGFFQTGDGGYQADYALFLPLSFARLQKVHRVKNSYAFSKYALFSHQCCHFIVELLKACDLHLQAQRYELQPVLRLGKISLPLWTDRSFAQIEYISPDALIKQLQSLPCNREQEITSVYRSYQKKPRLKRAPLRALGLR